MTRFTRAIRATAASVARNAGIIMNHLWWRFFFFSGSLFFAGQYDNYRTHFFYKNGQPKAYRQISIRYVLTNVLPCYFMIS